MKVELQKKPDQVWSTLYHRLCETYGNVQTKKMMVPSILTRFAM